MRFAGQVAVITGAARGQGRASALAFGREGAGVALTDVLSDELAETADLVRRGGARVVHHAGDISDPATIEALARLAVDEFGGVDILHNNAGILIGGSLEQFDVADFERLFRVNCVSQLLTLQRIAPLLRQRGGGAIVNTSSICGLAAVDHMGAYGATKAAILSLTRSAARELAGDNIRVNAVCPGGVDTPMAAGARAMFPDENAFLEFATARQLIKQFATPDNVISVVLFLASDESAFITGAAIPVEGGHTAW